jgi:hypothetical protein
MMTNLDSLPDLKGICQMYNLVYMVIYGMRGKGTALKLQREVKPFGDAAHVLVPKSWIGWEVQIKALRPKGKVENQVDLKTERFRKG